MKFGPYLTSLSTKSVSVSIKLNQIQSLSLKVVSPTGKVQVFDNQAADFHVFKISGLEPNTRYQYSFVKNDKEILSDPSYYFQTENPDESQYLRVWAMGDFGDLGPNEIYRKNQVAVRDAYRKYSKKTDAWIWLGDNAYCCGTVDQYKNYVFDIYDSTFLHNTPIFPAPGNHEYSSSEVLRKNKLVDYYQLFDTPQKAELGGLASNTKSYYSFDKGSVHFVSLDSYGLENNLGLADSLSVQYQWLQKDLAQNTKTWIVVFFHHPPYTSQSHNSDAEAELAKIRTHLVPLFDKYKVDLVLNGHSHVYERTKLINHLTGHSATFRPENHEITKKYGADCPYISKTNGTYYAVVGSAGRIDEYIPNPGPMPSFAYSNTKLGGSLVIDVNNTHLIANWLGADGQIYDTFELFKNTNKTYILKPEFGEPVNMAASWQAPEYLWNTGMKTKGLTISQSTTKALFTVTNSAKCLADTFRIEPLPKPTINITQLNFAPVICNGTDGSANFSLVNSSKKQVEYKVEISDAEGKWTMPMVLANGIDVAKLDFVLPDNLVASNQYKLRISSGNLQFLEVSEGQTIKVEQKPILNFDKPLYYHTELIKLNLQGSFPIEIRYADGAKYNALESPVLMNFTDGLSGKIQVTASNICGKDLANATVEVAQMLANAELEYSLIYPNPAIDFLKIKVEKEMDFQIIDEKGQVTLAGTTNGILNVKNLHSGVYFLFLPQIKKYTKFVKN